MHNPQIVFTAPGRVELREGPMPGPPGARQLRVRNLFSMVSPGTELACLSGNEAWFKLPGHPGYCAVGEVEAAGPDTAGWQVGSKILHYGHHQAWQMVDVTIDHVFPIPEGVALSRAPAARLATIAMTALRQSHIQLGDDVLVTGLGPVGNLAAQLATLQGARVIAFDPDASRLDLAKACGLSTAFAARPEDRLEEVMGLTGGQGASTLIEASGRAGTVLAALPLLGQGGEVILLGTPRQECQADLTGFLMPFHLASRALCLRPAHEWIFPARPSPFAKHSFVRNTRIVFELIASGRLRLDALISQIVPPSQAQTIYDGLRQRRPELVGVVFDWRS